MSIAKPDDHTLRIGTRGSKLALWQAGHVAGLLRRAHPGLRVELTVIKTKGDTISDVALPKLGDKGVFTKELEAALLAGEVDICVHSMKDLPTQLPDGLDVAAMLTRADVRDVLVAAPGTTLASLPTGARVGTSALRRLAQMRLLRSDLHYVDLRGNVDTRIDKVQGGQLDAAVLASAGICRMGWQVAIACYLDTAQVLPAVGQGAIGIEARVGDERTAGLCKPLNDAATMLTVGIERQVMQVLDGGCQAPLAALCTLDGGMLELTAFVAVPDASRVARTRQNAAVSEAGALVKAAVADLLAQDADAIMAEAGSLA